MTAVGPQAAGIAAAEEGARPLARLQRQLADDGYVVLPRAVDDVSVQAALRLLHLAIRAHGLTADEILHCQNTTFFPHLRWEPEVWSVLPPQAAELLGWQEGDDWAEPQLLLRFPDEVQAWPPAPHVDEPPAWASGQPYLGVVGVALTPTGTNDGGILVWPGSHTPHASPDANNAPTTTPLAVPLAAGDAVVLHPQLLHSGSLNVGASIRSIVYFRLLRGPLPLRRPDQLL